MWIYWKILKVPWMSMKPYEKILRMIGGERKLRRTIKRILFALIIHRREDRGKYEHKENDSRIS